MLRAHGNRPWRKNGHTREEATQEPAQKKSLHFPDSQSCPDVLTTLTMAVFHLQDKSIPTQVHLDAEMYWATIKDPAFCQNMASVKHFRNRIGKEQGTEEQINQTEQEVQMMT